MLARLKLLALAGIVAAGVLAPLYGDPRNSPVTHAEWARLLLRAIDLERGATTDQASQVFALLSWKNSLAWRADRYASAEGVRVVEEASRRSVVAGEGVGEVRYPLTIPRGGDYRLRVRLAGDPAQPAAAEIIPAGEVRPAGSFVVVPARVSTWVDAGATHLDPGVYETAVLLPPGTALEEIEVAPPCVSAIEPPGGWRATAVATTTDVAVTVLKALDREADLPPADVPIEASAAAFLPTTRGALPVAAGGLGGALRAGAPGVQAMVAIDVPETGLYTVSVFGEEGGGQSWLADACRKAVLCAASAAASGPQWRDVMTAPFTAGRHFLSVTLADGASVGRIRVQRRKDAPADYVATLARLGFDAGPEGPMARGKAVDAMRFIQGRRREVLAGACGDVQIPALMTVQGERGPSEPAPPVAGPGAPPFPGPAAPPVGTPTIPIPPPPGPPTAGSPSPPVTPPSGPPPSPPPSPTPPPPTPTPSPSPVPTPDISPPPPATPVSPAPGAGP